MVGRLLKKIFLIFGSIFFLIVGMGIILFVFKGKIYIELLIIVILLLMFLFWKMWFKSSKEKLIEAYDQKKDLGRLAEEEKKIIDNGKNKTKGGSFNGRAKGRESATSVSNASTIRLEQPEGHKLLSKPNANDDGETSSSNRKNGSGIRKLLRRK